jgi:hypothetical protein
MVWILHQNSMYPSIIIRMQPYLKNMRDIHSSTSNNRLGAHYVPDFEHYREVDLSNWLSHYQGYKLQWLILQAPLHYAIPESFIKQIISSGIEPVLHFKPNISQRNNIEEYDILFSAYAKWGVRYVILFDRPNCRHSWLSSDWTQANLVERFLDYYLPYAELLIERQLVPVFSPLEPGGDYWDTAFLRAALDGLKRRATNALLNQLAISAYAPAPPLEKPFYWGQGGPERWPDTRPYFTPDDQQDHQGFFIYEWYLAIASAVLGKTLPILLLEVAKQETLSNPMQAIPQEQKNRISSLIQLCRESFSRNGESSDSNMMLTSFPPQLLACNFWDLSILQASIEAHSHPQDGSLDLISRLALDHAWVDLQDCNDDQITLLNSQSLPAQPVIGDGTSIAT